ncbi:57_t:CDS:1, partial [Dentiscutata heterogama]
ASGKYTPGWCVAILDGASSTMLDGFNAIDKIKKHPENVNQ